MIAKPGETGAKFAVPDAHFPAGMATFFSSPVPVLTYHRVLPFKTSLSVTVDKFEQQLLWLKEKGFHTLTSLEFQHALSGEHEVRHGLVITFDDGYRDSWHLAAPLLRKYGMNALLFAITGRIKEGEPKPITDAWREEGDERYLSWQELREMVESGIFEIHSHTHTHDFSWIQAPSEEARRMVQQDIATSVQTLRDRGYAHELHLAWPWRYFRKDWDLLKIKVSIFRDFKQLDAAAGRSPALHQKIQRLRCYLCPCANGSGS